MAKADRQPTSYSLIVPTGALMSEINNPASPISGKPGLVSASAQERFCEIAASLHQSRLDQGLTLVEVAQRSSLSPVVIQAIEACDFKNLPETWPNGVCLQRYADVLGLRGADLVKGLTRRASAR